ncbi:MAG: hypothetical protein ACI97A_002411 [Planctomycetota bacterium]|jgi:hypothetical protein
MKSRLIFLCPIILTLVTTVATGQGSDDSWSRGRLLKALDANGDGKLSKAEIAYAAQTLLFLDDDGDGKLSKLEVAGKSRWGSMDDWDGGSFGGRGSRPEGKGKNPEEIDAKDGASSIPDRKAFERLHAMGENILGKAGVQYVKFQIEDGETPKPKIYFINTKTHVAHSIFMSAIGKSMGPSSMRGALNYRPFLMAPNGTQGLYTFVFEMQKAFPYEKIRFAYDLLQAKAPMLKGKLAYFPMAKHKTRYRKEKAQFEAGDMPVMLPENIYRNIGFLPLNEAASFGRLRVIRKGDRPQPRDIVILNVLPNQMPRVAGVISEMRQTPLSHVNLRAVQDGVPNAFLKDASSDKKIATLIGKFVFYQVKRDGFTIREASLEEVETHFSSTRPQEAILLARNLEVKTILPLAKISFADATAFGVKASNLATLTQIGIPQTTVPAGFAVPFHFYDAFMKENNLYQVAKEMLEEKSFDDDPKKRRKALKSFRKKIKKATFSSSSSEAIERLQRSFGEGMSIRCRSSTNNEDMPKFSGAGLYDSFTHHPKEGKLNKSIKQVYASLWNYRAFEERAFYRVDHFTVAMGVLVHRNFKGELANGVAVTQDILYHKSNRKADLKYFVNTQVGEDLVTNPEEKSIPEEILLSPHFPCDDQVVRYSNHLKTSGLVLNMNQRALLRVHLKTIVREFRKLYKKSAKEKFAMEIEFKIAHDGQMWIKQARPWVFLN